jgi:hypothetical protein
VFEFSVNHFCLELVRSRLGEENVFSYLNHGLIMADYLAESIKKSIKLKKSYKSRRINDLREIAQGSFA